jgi:lipooligosaccharide transport system permease protein
VTAPTTAGARSGGRLGGRLGGLGGRRALRLVERALMLYRRTPSVLISGAFEPLFYLVGIGFGLGALVGSLPAPDGTPIPYGAFVAPGLLAASAMNGAMFEATMNFFFKLRYQKLYDAILSTPLGVGDVAVGEVTWALMRGALYATSFILIAAALGLILSPLAILAIPGALLIGFAFGAIGMAMSSFMRSWQDFDLVQLPLLPMFLFSATFFPLDAYPPVLQTVVQLTPLYHGVALERALTTGHVGPENLVNVAYLVVMGLIGLVLVARRLHLILLK